MTELDPTWLQHEFRERLELVERAFARKHPPYWTRRLCIHRSHQEQGRRNQAWRLGGGPRASAEGKSLHEWPERWGEGPGVCACDMGIFLGVIYLDGNPVTELVPYEWWLELCEPYGLTTLLHLGDGAHTQVKGYTWEDARAGRLPEFPPLPFSVEAEALPPPHGPRYAKGEV